MDLPLFNIKIRLIIQIELHLRYQSADCFWIQTLNFDINGPGWMRVNGASCVKQQQNIKPKKGEKDLGF